jgi:hypothetical protein
MRPEEQRGQEGKKARRRWLLHWAAGGLKARVQLRETVDEVTLKHEMRISLANMGTFTVLNKSQRRIIHPSVYLQKSLSYLDVGA